MGVLMCSVYAYVFCYEITKDTHLLTVMDDRWSAFWSIFKNDYKDPSL